MLSPLRCLTNGAVAVALVLAAATPAAAQDKTPYDLPAIVSVTGAGAFVGAPVGATYKIIEDAVNASGGINGRPLRITVLDDQSNPQVAVQLMQGLIAKNAPVVMGPMLTASCAAVMPLLAERGPVAYCTSPFVNPPAHSFMFMQGGSALDYAVVSLRYLKERGLTRVAALNATDGTGQATDKALEQAFGFNEFRDMRLVAHYRFAPGDVSVAAQVAQIKASGAQALITFEVGPPFGTVMHGVTDAGLGSLPIIAIGANASEGQMRALASAMPTDLHFIVGASWVTEVREPAPVLEKIATFRRTVTAAGAPADGAHAAAWDTAMIVIDTLRRLPPDPSAAAVRDAIARLHDYAGSNGFYDFRFGNQSGAGQTIYLLAHWDAQKKAFVSSSLPGGHVVR